MTGYSPSLSKGRRSRWSALIQMIAAWLDAARSGAARRAKRSCSTSADGGAVHLPLPRFGVKRLGSHVQPVVGPDDRAVLHGD